MDTIEKNRLEQLTTLFAGAGYHALLCRLPQHVLLFTGYQPILGNTFCLITLNRAGELEIRLAVPADEQDLVPQGVAVEVETFAEETLDYIGNTLDAVRGPLGKLLRSAGLGTGSILGIEGGHMPIISAYTQVGIPGPETHDLLHLLLLGGELRDASALFQALSAVKTSKELEAIRRSEAVGYAAPGAYHVQPHVHVMAGARAALAYRAFNLTSNATIEQGDTVTVQMEIGINGYWAELTRTFFARSVSDEWRSAHKACLAAQDAALRRIRDGANTRSVDHAARQVMHEAGFGETFKHGLGHGFGFQAINHGATPVLHPVSKEILRSGMVHNMEPAVYLEGRGGFRLNDNVAVHIDGNEVLSSALPRDIQWLLVEQ